MTNTESDLPEDKLRERATTPNLTIGHEFAIVSRAFLIEAADALASIRAERDAAVAAPHGIYIASKTKHAARWRALRDEGMPIISTWIDEAGEGESQDLNDLWRRCLAESSGAAAMVIYREPDEVLKGGWVELGAAASHGVPVFAVGLESFTISKHSSINHFATFDEALRAARAIAGEQKND